MSLAVSREAVAGWGRFPVRPGRVARPERLAKITTLSVAPLIGEAIRRIHRGESVGALFSSEVSLTQEMVLWEGGDEGTIDTRSGEPGDDGEPPSVEASIDAFAASAQASER